MLSSPGGLDTGEQNQGASQTSQSQVKDNETKTRSTVSVKPFRHTIFVEICTGW
jgi:hypothetical protein